MRTTCVIAAVAAAVLAQGASIALASPTSPRAETAAAGAAASASRLGTAAEPRLPLYKDASQPIPARVADLLPRMTLEEKIPQLFAPLAGPSALFKRFANGSGLGAASMMGIKGACQTNVSECVAARNQVQARLSNARLGIPVSIMSEALHGGAQGGVVFPMPVSTGCSWNLSLAQAIGGAIAEQARSVGVDVGFAPVINMWTDGGRFGRNQEGFSENPTVSSRLGAAYTVGLQGAGTMHAADEYLPAGKVIGLAKHYAAYGAAMGGLNGGPADISNRTLHDVYLRPWKAYAASGGRGAMPAHNTIAGVPCHGNAWLINTRLRDTYGFGNGITVSDCNDIGVLADFRFAANRTHAAALGLAAGVDYDLQCGNDESEFAYTNLAQAIDDGLVDEAAVDIAVTHVLTSKFATGLFDRPMVPTDAWKGVLDSPAHVSLARQAAQESIVLMVNGRGTYSLLQQQQWAPEMAVASPPKPFLPISLSGSGAPKSIAVLGPLANSTTALLGSYTLYTDKQFAVTTIPDAIRAAAMSAKVTIVAGAEASGPPNAGNDQIPAAVAAAKDADLVVMVLGDDVDTCGEWVDRDSLDFPGGQQALLDAVVAIGDVPVVVVLVNGRTATFGADGSSTPNAALDQVDAVLEAWRPGSEGAAAVVDVITGAVNPSGKLAQSWRRSAAQSGGGASPWLAEVRGKWVANDRGTADADGRRYDNYVGPRLSTPLFYFGHGLSYTTFEYQHIAAAPGIAAVDPTMTAGGGGSAAGGDSSGTAVLVPAGGSSPVLNVSVTLRNSGSVSGEEVVQVYARDPPGVAPVVSYWKRLVGFAKVMVAPGTTVTVTVPVYFDDLSTHGEQDMVPRVYMGTYLFTAGGASNADTLAVNVTLPAMVEMCDVQPGCNESGVM